MSELQQTQSEAMAAISAHNSVSGPSSQAASQVATSQAFAKDDPVKAPDSAATGTAAAAATTTGAAATSGAAAPAEQKVGDNEVKLTAAPVTAGNLAYKAPGLVNQIRAKHYYFWLGSEAVPISDLGNYLRKNEGDEAKHNAAWSSETGEGLLYYAKREEDKSSPSGVINLATASEVAKQGTKGFSFLIAKHKHTFEAPEADRNGWIVALESAVEKSKALGATIGESANYKETHSALSKPVLAAGAASGAAAAVAAVHSKENSDKPTADKATAEPAVAEKTTAGKPAVEASKEATAEPAKTTLAAPVDEKNERAKSRSQSRKRQSFFGGLLGKKEPEEKDDKAAEKEAKKEKEAAEKEAKKEREAAEIKAKKEKEAAEAKAKKEKEAAEKEAKKEKEHADKEAKKAAAAETKKEEKAAAAEAKKEEKVAAAEAKKEEKAADKEAKKEEKVAEESKKEEKAAAATTAATVAAPATIAVASGTIAADNAKATKTFHEPHVATHDGYVKHNGLKTATAAETAEAAPATAAAATSTSKANKRRSIFDMFNNARSASTERYEDEVVAKSKAEKESAHPTTGESAVEEAAATGEAAPAERSTEGRRRSSFFGALSGSMKKGQKEASPEPEAAAATTPAATTTEASTAGPEKTEKVEKAEKTEKGGLPAKINDLFRRNSKQHKAGDVKDAKKEVTSPSAVAEEEAPKLPETAKADDAAPTAEVPTSQTNGAVIGDVVPEAITVGQAQTTTAAPVQTAA